jgi:hypothetical protein
VGVSIPDSFDLDVDHSGALALSGIPANYSIDVTHLPKIELRADPITVNPITINPLDVSVRLKEFPSIRGHIPANFTVALSVLGLPVVRLQLCGEAQLITEPYVPNPCERCEPVAERPQPPKRPAE